jgi:hypothetical protein
VADGQIAVGDVRPLALEQRGEVQPWLSEGRCVGPGLVPQLGMHQHVPGDQDGSAPDGSADRAFAMRRFR